MAYDGSIRINTKIDGKGFDTGVKRMMSSLGSLAASLGVVFVAGWQLWSRNVQRKQVGRFRYGEAGKASTVSFLQLHQRRFSANDERTASLQKHACPWLQYGTASDACL